VAKKALAEIDPALYKLPLEQLGLSGRTLNLLIGSSITNVGELLTKSDKELLELKGFGNKSLLEVKERVEMLAPPVTTVEAGIELPAVDAEVTVEEVTELIEVPEEVEEEGEEIIPYEAPKEAKEQIEKPQIRFAEDIFPERAAAVATQVSGKKGKKKKVSREERQETVRPKQSRKTRDVSVDVDDDDLSEEQVSEEQVIVDDEIGEE